MARRLQLEPLEGRQLPSNLYSVTSTLDDGSAGSLRWAITQVDGDATDSAASPDQIRFNIPQADPGFSGGVWTIAPLAALPAVTNPVVIDGYTQTGASPNTNGPGLGDNAVLTIVLSGAKAPAGINGLELSSAGITVRGLVVDDVAFGNTTGVYGSNGIIIDGAGGDVVEGNFIGVNAQGSAALANGGNGVLISNVSGNTIGGTTPAARNVIAGNGFDGVYAFGNFGGVTSDNLIAGNFIGLDATGTVAIPNRYGVEMNSGSGNTVGGTAAGAQNVIAGNKTQVAIASGLGDNVVQGNYVGTDVTGSAAIAGGTTLNSVGIAINGRSGDLIGGTVAGAGNLISGNGSGIDASGAVLIAGNLIGTDATGQRALGNVIGVFIANDVPGLVTIGGTDSAARNVIAASAQAGIEIFERSAGTLIEGNYIGTDARGVTALPNVTGIYLGGGAGNNAVGSAGPGGGNLIAGNSRFGIDLDSEATPARSMDNQVQGNIFGLNAAGARLANYIDIGLNAANGGTTTGNTIGGTAVGAGNTVAASGFGGIVLDGPGVVGNLVAGNSIGDDQPMPAGSFATAPGVKLSDGASNNTVGGATSGAGNLIAGQLGEGVLLTDAGTAGNVIVGNDVEANPATSLQTGLGDGIAIRNGAAENTIGGTSLGAGNLIARNARAGIVLSDAGTTGNAVVGNAIGATVAGNAVPNGAQGVLIESGAAGNTVGGADPGAGNLIAFNQGAGVAVVGATTVANAIEANSIFGNAVLGIDLGGSGVPLPNTPGGPHTGPNALQNTPTLTSAFSNGVDTLITGTLNSAPNQSFRLELFSNPVAGLPESAQGKTFLGAIDVATDAAGNAPAFAFTEHGDLTGRVVTATATDASSDTSEFAGGLSVPHYAPPVLRLVPAPPAELVVGPVMIVATAIAPAGQPATAGTIHVVDESTGVDLGTHALQYESSAFEGPTLRAGRHVLVLTYSGDAHYPAATARGTIVIQPAATGTALNTVPATSITGQPVTLVAPVNAFLGTTVAPDTPRALTAQAMAPDPPLSGTVTFWDGAVALGTVPVAPNGFATFTTSGLGPGTHALIARFSGDANYQASTSSAVIQTVDAAAGPTVLSARRYGASDPSALVVAFSAPLDPARADDLANYRVSGPGRRPIDVEAVVYSPSSGDVTLFLARKLNPRRPYRLRVVGTAPGGITDAYGNLLDGNGSGHPGSDYAAVLRPLHRAFRQRVPAGPGHTPRPRHRRP